MTTKIVAILIFILGCDPPTLSYETEETPYVTSPMCATTRSEEEPGPTIHDCTLDDGLRCIVVRNDQGAGISCGWSVLDKNPDTIYNRLSIRLGRPVTNAEVIAEVKRIQQP